MAAVRMLFDYLVTGGILAHNPLLSLRAPRQSVTKGKTPTLSAEDAGELLRAIETNNLAGLRDRAFRIPKAQREPCRPINGCG
jgi:site-specific recombinase XerC